MALIGITLILASVVYLAIRRPPLMETLLALWRGQPKIEQPPTSPPPKPVADDDNHHGGVAAKTVADDKAAVAPPPPPPPPIITSPESEGKSDNKSARDNNHDNDDDEDDSSPQTTPKASATQLTDSGVPTFVLSPEPPASAAAVSRSRPSTTTSTTAGGAAMPPPPIPSLSAPAPAPASQLMPPPPPPTLRAPPTLNPIPGSSPSSTLSAPPRPSPLPPRGAPQQFARQPGTSTLAPPPTHTSKPSKPSRKVTLEPGCSPLDWARLSSPGGPTGGDLRGLEPGTPYLRVTPSQLAAQNGRRGRDAWTALGGKVYNVTPYARFHPGGKGELLRAAGRDGTRLFAEVHPWVNYDTMLAACLVGVLVSESEGHGGEMEEMD